MELKDANQVSSILPEELNGIFNKISLEKRVGVCRKNQPYLENYLRDRMTDVDNLLTTAIQSKDRDNWWVNNNARNNLCKYINTAKSEYLPEQLNNKWTG